jgi:hypothetical protein
VDEAAVRAALGVLERAEWEHPLRPSWCCAPMPLPLPSRSSFRRSLPSLLGTSSWRRAGSVRAVPTSSNSRSWLNAGSTDKRCSAGVWP